MESVSELSLSRHRLAASSLLGTEIYHVDNGTKEHLRMSENARLFLSFVCGELLNVYL